jgi:hypothetical protein
MIGGTRAKSAGVVKPVHESENGTYGGQDEGADDDKGSTGFHVLT